MSLLCFECAGVKRGRCLLRNYELIKIVFRHDSLLPVAACVLKKFNGHKHTTVLLWASLSVGQNRHDQDDKATMASSTRGCVVRTVTRRSNPFEG